MLSLDQTFTFRDQAVAWGTIGEGEPIILIHGFPWSAHRLARRRRADRPGGVGGSQRVIEIARPALAVPAWERMGTG